MTDFLSALRLYLLAQQTITDLCGSSIYVLAIPKEELDAVDATTGLAKGAHKIVVLISSGGELRSRRTMTAARVDVVCYAETDFEAAKLERAVAQSCKDLCRETYANVLLHGATIAAGPFQARDPETFWPAMRRQIILRADEREVGSATV